MAGALVSRDQFGGVFFLLDWFFHSITKLGFGLPSEKRRHALTSGGVLA
jgi:hypothetical protein